MKVRRQDEGDPTLVFEEMEPFFIALLRRLPQDADPADNAAARARLFSNPLGPADDGDGFNEDWRRYVQPEIQDLFRSAREMVSEDLAALPPPNAAEPVWGLPTVPFDPVAFAPSDLSFRIPDRHAQAWMSVLNQARLVIASRRGFDEASMEQDMPFPPFSERDLDLFKVHFFDLVQQILLKELGFG